MLIVSPPVPHRTIDLQAEGVDTHVLCRTLQFQLFKKIFRQGVDRTFSYVITNEELCVTIFFAQEFPLRICS
ncbi:MAG: hypothetical protein K0S79_482 [Nitrospira sp.]|jgi:hypothetical protein|nr:hypothetical protein [Nitrospira sp.]MDF2458066.1 hypothetical protein [Nitrospira sp.]